VVGEKEKKREQCKAKNPNLRSGGDRRVKKDVKRGGKLRGKLGCPCEKGNSN